MAHDTGSFMRVPAWLNSTKRCRDCSVLVSEGERCDYCTEHPYRMRGVCVNCGGKIHDQQEFRFKLFGNFCFSCDLNAESKTPEIPPHPSLF